jgi:hypothetical protein
MAGSLRVPGSVPDEHRPRRLVADAVDHGALMLSP